MKKIFLKLFNRETMTYLAFGVLTTIISFFSLKLFDMLLGSKLYLLSNTFSWILSVAFAFVTNKLFVFLSTSWKWSVLKRELSTFVLARIASYFIEQGTIWLCMSPLHFEGRIFDFYLFKLSGLMTAKVIASVLVVILNYIFSKLVTFKKKSPKKNS